MNTTAQQLRLAADILETGHPFEYFAPYCAGEPDPHWEVADSRDKPVHHIYYRREIRPVLATPPDGRPLHNPDNLTAEQVGVGYRLTVVGEPFNRKAELWHRRVWCRATSFMGQLTYRLPLSTPWPPAPVDPYAELKAAHAAGKVVQVKDGNEWVDQLMGYNWAWPPHYYRIKPEPPPFQLPPPPPGMQWHRHDGWKAEDLPPGTRPLVDGEKEQWGDEYWSDSGQRWKTTPDIGRVVSGMFRLRTTRPLVFERAGKSWTYHRPGDPMPCDGARSVCILYKDNQAACISSANAAGWRRNESKPSDIIGWRYAEPTTREVELGPEDVPPFSVIRRKGEEQNWHWRLLSYVHGTHAICADRGYTWSELARDYEINRSVPLTGKWNPEAWEKCSKTITTP